MRTIYIRRPDGEIIRIPEDMLQTQPKFYKTDVHENITKDMTHIKGTLSFTLKGHISRKLLRPVRRWSRKKAQQKKRKLVKEKKHGLLHTETRTC